MRCLDTTFLVDYFRGEAAAVRKVQEMIGAAEGISIPAVAAAEVLVGAYYRGKGELARTLEFLEQLQILPFAEGEAAEAGRMGAESLHRGLPLAGNDLLIAATARHHRGILVSRDAAFSQVPGLAVEAY